MLSYMPCYSPIYPRPSSNMSHVISSYILCHPPISPMSFSHISLVIFPIVMSSPHTSYVLIPYLPCHHHLYPMSSYHPPLSPIKSILLYIKCHTSLSSLSSCYISNIFLHYLSCYPPVSSV